MSKPNLRTRGLGALVGSTLLALSFASGAVMAQEKVLRIGMTAADIPRTLGQPDQGFEGNRFTGIPMYDSLTQWGSVEGGCGQRDHPRPRHLLGGGRQDKTKWVFKLRRA